MTTLRWLFLVVVSSGLALVSASAQATPEDPPLTLNQLVQRADAFVVGRYTLVQPIMEKGSRTEPPQSILDVSILFGMKKTALADTVSYHGPGDPVWFNEPPGQSRPAVLPWYERDKTLEGNVIIDLQPGTSLSLLPRLRTLAADRRVLLFLRRDPASSAPHYFLLSAEDPHNGGLWEIIGSQKRN